MKFGHEIYNFYISASECLFFEGKLNSEVQCQYQLMKNSKQQSKENITSYLIKDATTVITPKLAMFLLNS